MKRVEFDKKFIKSDKLRISNNSKLSKKYDDRHILFCEGERGNPLNDHPLTGKKLGLRAFLISGDIRVVYKETDDAFIFLDIGTHNQVY